MSPLAAQAGQPTISLLGAVIQTLEHSPGVKVELEAVEQSRGALQKATGSFDHVLSSAAGVSSTDTPASQAQKEAKATSFTTPLDVYHRDADTFSLTLGRQFRSGLSLGASLATVSEKNNADQTDMANWSEVKLVFTVPLLRGLGEEATGAEETAAKINLVAAERLAKHNISQRVLATVESYWSTWSAEKTFEILKDTGKRAEEMVALVKKFIAAGELAPSFIHQVDAKLYARRTDLDRARLKLEQSRQSLGLAMGLTPKQLQMVPHPAKEAPSVVEPEKLTSLNPQRLVSFSLARRGDYLSAESKARAQKVLVKKARNSLLPSLNFSLEGGYSGLYESAAFERHLASVWSQPRGLNVLSGFALELPLENNAAKGEYARQESLLRQVLLQRKLLRNSIASEVILSVQSLKSSINQYQMATRSSAAYQKAAQDVHNRLVIGDASVFELIDIEDKYFDARVSEAEALIRYVIAMARLRFSTGTILKENNGALIFNLDCVASLPKLTEQPPRAKGSEK